MIAHSHKKGPPKLRLKKNQLEMYESIFQHQRTKEQEFKPIPATANGTLRPLNPPPFSLATVNKRSVNGKPVVTSQATAGTTQEVTPGSLQSKPLIPANTFSKNSSSNSSEETEIAALLTSLKKSDSATSISSSTSHSKTSVPSIPDLEKHFQRDSIPPPIDMTRPIVLNSYSLLQNKSISMNDFSRIRAVSMDSHSMEIHASRRSISPEHDAVTIVPMEQKKTARNLKRTGPNIVPMEEQKHVARKRYQEDYDTDSEQEEEQEEEYSPSRKTTSGTKKKRRKLTLSSTSSSSTSTTSTKSFSKNIPQSPSKKPIAQNTTQKTRAVLRKKFSWKHYPELETFLIDNREEYLRHSALNYTMEQKNYNNNLTHELIALANSSGYVFDEAFTFVMIRDRIRCYFKSYVQSRKKKGAVIGYAARKAGLLGEDEVERSGKDGSIGGKKKRRK
ncbi:hypothetical protein CTEN210_00829 [Chaetoceros tenuissimus]|uniref:Uncharacterized protein n=1 Tax=Chaetoceros tenuissimus TaxID=426638 RepID=A0AAD3CGU1_9STRA|nr:hypothetical protein CTEN210_00829 [Chaetoceros tenuissimus]